MRESDKKMIEDNMFTVECVVRELIRKKYIQPNDFEDYCQIGYMMLCRKVSLYDGRVKFKTFADRVLRNGFIDIYRTKHELETVSYDDAECDAEIIKFLANRDETADTVIENAIEEMMNEHIQRIKGACTAKTVVKGFEALELKLKGYNGVEIAKMFDVPDNSLRAWMSKAKKLLIKDAGVQEFLNSLKNGV